MRGEIERVTKKLKIFRNDQSCSRKRCQLVWCLIWGSVVHQTALHFQLTLAWTCSVVVTKDRKKILKKYIYDEKSIENCVYHLRLKCQKYGIWYKNKNQVLKFEGRRIFCYGVFQTSSTKYLNFPIIVRSKCSSPLLTNRFLEQLFKLQAITAILWPLCFCDFSLRSCVTWC